MQTAFKIVVSFKLPGSAATVEGAVSAFESTLQSDYTARLGGLSGYAIGSLPSPLGGKLTKTGPEWEFYPKMAVTLDSLPSDATHDLLMADLETTLRSLLIAAGATDIKWHIQLSTGTVDKADP